MPNDGGEAAGTVVVGYDGSGHADEALRYGLAEGARRDSPVQVVLVVEPPEAWSYTYYGVPPAPEAGALREKARTWVEGRVEEVRGALDAPLRAVPVEVVAVSGSPTVALAEYARGAELLVVGHRGRGAVSSALLGSVGLSVVLHAPCPVTVVPLAPDHEIPAQVAAPEAGPLPIGPIA
jgi:nucleotide-binding universal stress UspA family protein